MNTVRTRCLVVALAAAATGCDGVGPEAPGTPGLTILTGSYVQDTIYAPVQTPLTVVVRDRAGLRLARVEVAFQPLLVSYVRDELPYSVATVWVGTDRGWSWPAAQPVVDTTDAFGEAHCHLMMGTHAGPGGVRILVPALGLEDTALALVKPGRPVSVRVSPADSALYVADSYQLRGEALDRIGNPIDTTAVFGTTDTVVSVTAAGLVTGRAYGRASITATIGGRTVAAGVSVVPRGTLAAYRWLAYVGDTISVVTVELNGSGRQRIAMGEASATAEEPPEHEMDPAWDPTGDTVAFHELGPSGYRIFLTGMDGAPRRLLPSPTLRLERHPAFSPDGRWIYFTGLAAGDFYPSLWRARRDGSGLERVPFDSTEGESRPQISPDGGQVAFAAGQPDREPFIRVRDLATGQATPLEARGTSPRWSPAGDLIAYVDTYDYSGYSGQLRVVRPDGSADRAVVSGVAYGAGLDWSPDGRFLVARSSENRLELVEVATGERIPLPYSSKLLRPSWRPERIPAGAPRN